MGGMPWFRMYAEFLTDPKVQMLSEVDQRRFIMLLCIRCCNDEETLHETFDETTIAFQLRISVEEWRQTLSHLMVKGLVNDYGHPLNWDKRQYHSDSSTARVRKHREMTKRFSNDDVTPPDTDTDTDTDKKTPITPFDEFWSIWPKRRAKQEAMKAWKRLKVTDELWPLIRLGIERGMQSRDWLKEDGQFIPNPATWLNQRRWEDEVVVAFKPKAAPADDFWRGVI